MVSTQTQKKILVKSLSENNVPFEKEEDSFCWSGTTSVKSKTTGRVYHADIRIVIKSNRKLVNQMEACLCKSEGIRFDDLIIVSMIDSRMIGRIEINGLPGGPASFDFLKFMKQTSADTKK